jgi:hypothetical protein
MIEAKLINKIFKALDRQIAVHNGSPFSIVVCGGTALAALGLIFRTTKDVDVLGEVVHNEQKIEIKKIDHFPQWFIDASGVVGRDFGLTKYWIDNGPAFQLESGLPLGFEQRLVQKVYGEYLCVYFISRIDQIYFKLFAALDRDGYHVDDLFKLKPSPDEMLKAAKWVLIQDDSEEFKIKLYDFLKKKGFHDIVSRI